MTRWQLVDAGFSTGGDYTALGTVESDDYDAVLEAMARAAGYDAWSAVPAERRNDLIPVELGEGEGWYAFAAPEGPRYGFGDAEAAAAYAARFGTGRPRFVTDPEAAELGLEGAGSPNAADPNGPAGFVIAELLDEAAIEDAIAASGRPRPLPAPVRRDPRSADLSGPVALYRNTLQALRGPGGRLPPNAETAAWEAALAAAGLDPAKPYAERSEADWALVKRLQQAIATDTDRRATRRD